MDEQTGSLNKKIKKGVVWSTVDFAAKAGLQFVFQIVLARLLFPEDFGLLGMALVVTTILKAFVEMGMGAALVQIDESKYNNNILNTAFWSSFGINIFLYLIIAFVVGPIAADFYNEPQLIKIFPVLTFNIIINSFNMVQLVQLTRSMDFKKLAYAGIISMLASTIICIVLAYLNYGVWSLVIQQPLMALIALPVYIYFNKWFPKFHWNIDEFKQIFSFGMYTTGTQLTNSLTSQIDYLLIGKLLNSQQLGLYSLAFQITDLVKSKVVTIITKVMYPVYAKVQNDKQKIRGYYQQVVKSNFLIVAPIMLVLLLYAEDFVLVFFGEKWADAIPLIEILSLASIIQVLASSNTSLIRGIGYPKLEFQLQLLKTLLIFVPSIIIGVKLNGVIGAAWAVLVNYTFAVIIAHIVLYKLIGYTIIDLWNGVKTILLCLIIASLTYLIYKFIWHNFYFGIVSWCVSYLGLICLFLKKEIRILIKRN